jgi:prepilin-type N-terminal cleavage/methylation domain-containing protein
MQRGFTIIELLICMAVLGLIVSMAALTLQPSLAQQELESTARQLAADIRLLQQLSINSGANSVAYALLFTQTSPYGYYITANTQMIKHTVFPKSVRLSGNCTLIFFNSNGTPVMGAQTISLYSTTLKTLRYVMLAPVTGRVRISQSMQ